MRFRSIALSAAGLAMFLLQIGSAGAAPSVFPTGVTRYEPSKAYNCDVLFTAADQKTYLIDMDGRVLHRWDRTGFPAKMLNPDLTGGIKGEIGVQLRQVSAGKGRQGVTLVPGQRGIFADLTFGYVNWSGKTIWGWGTQAPGGAALQHHDWQLLPDGDTLLLSNRVARIAGFGNRNMLDAVIYEVNSSGRIIWSWTASQHLGGLGFSGARLRVMERRSDADYLHMNAAHTLGPNHWAAAGDRRFAPGNILISSRNANFIAIISRKTGRIVWRLGPQFAASKRLLYSAADAGAAPKVPYQLTGFSGQHNAHMIPEGLPGAGDILVFDDQGEGGYPPATLPVIGGSRVIEINPVTHKVVWQYAGSKVSFFSSFLGSAQRLPNGNTLIDSGMWGRIFQVTPKGRIVWEYVSPFTGKIPGTFAETAIRWVYRAQPVPYSWVPRGVKQSQLQPVRPPALTEFHIGRS